MGGKGDCKNIKIGVYLRGLNLGLPLISVDEPECLLLSPALKRVALSFFCGGVAVNYQSYYIVGGVYRDGFDNGKYRQQKCSG